VVGYQLLAPAVADANLLSVGEEAIDRGAVGAGEYPLDSGTIFFTFFTARRTEQITTIRTGVYGTAADGLDLARCGIWTVAANGGLTPLVSSVSDTDLWTATFTRHTATLSATWNKQAGVRYACGLLAVGDTMPVLAAQGVKYLDVADAPRIQAELAGQTDFPAGTIAAAPLADGYRRFQAIFGG
jgi:hypothetical protein